MWRTLFSVSDVVIVVALVFYLFVYFSPVHRHTPRRVNAKSYLLAFNGNDFDSDAITDHDFFFEFSGQVQHDFLLERANSTPLEFMSSYRIL